MGNTNSLTKHDIENTLSLIRELYHADSIPWVIGYSGGKDSTATVQLVWTALMKMPPNELKKEVHIISTDTLVESPVIKIWLSESLEKMDLAAKKSGMPIQVHKLTPIIEQTFWVNLIGRGYPFPRRSMRWCTDRLKIAPANRFVETVISRAGEAIMVLGTRKSESSARKNLMENYEKRRIREHLSPSSSLPNSFVFSPIENWTSSNVWQYLMQYPNNWGQSNKELLSMYSGASADGECPLVLDLSTPSCGNSRFGCWVCTMVSEDKSMAAMIHNDEQKAWMLPLLDFRNDIGAQRDVDRDRRDFRRMTGTLTLRNNELVHGPYKRETRLYFLRRLLEVEQTIQENGPSNIEKHSLISMDELRMIRKIWLEEKHEFDDSLPRIYRDVTGEEFDDPINRPNRYFGHHEWKVLDDVCKTMFPEEELLLQLSSSLLDIESRYNLQATRKGVNKALEQVVKKSYYKNEEDALRFYLDYLMENLPLGNISLEDTEELM